MTISVGQPFPQFFGSDGEAIDGGFVYIGQPSQNPETVPVDVFSDAACTINVDQPLRTVGGFVVDGSGAKITPYVAGSSFSITVRNSIGVLQMTAPEYTWRGDSSAITFGTLTVSTAVVPDASGGAVVGTDALAFSEVVARLLRARALKVYSQTQPAAPADLNLLTQLALPILAVNQNSITTTASFFNALNVNTASSTWTATGAYSVVPTIPLPSTNLIVLAGSIDDAGIGFRSVMARIVNVNLIHVRVFDPAGAAQDGRFSLAIFGNPGIADPIL